MIGVAVCEERWAAVSAGEYDRRTRVLSVNMTVVDEVHARFGHDRALVIATIVAHEHVHVHSTRDTLADDEEVRARAAAVAAGGAELVSNIDAVLAGAWR